MDRPNDPVSLSGEERRVLDALEDRIDRDDPRLKASLSFVQWPAVAIVGIGLQVVSLRALLIRWGPGIATGVQPWIDTRRQNIT